MPHILSSNFMTINLVMMLATFLILWLDKEIRVQILESKIADIETDTTWSIFFLSLLYPITLFQYFKLKNDKMKTLKKLTKVLAGILILVLAFNFGSNFVDFSNQEIGQRNDFERTKTERIALLEKMGKEFSLLANVTVHNDSMFTNIVEIQMGARKDGPNLSWKWLQEQNPTRDYDQVSKFYENLTTVISSNRNAFYAQEQRMQSVNYEHNNLIKKFPGSFYNSFLKRKEFSYKPILSSETLQIDSTGIDNRSKIF